MPFYERGDGTVTFKFKRYASYIDQNTQEVKPLPLEVVDPQGTPIENFPAIADDSELKVKFSQFPYSLTPVAGASVKLSLEGLMLVKLVELDDSNGWEGEVVEGGYTVDDTMLIHAYPSTYIPTHCHTPCPSLGIRSKPTESF
jgi:hypothetical protein